MVYGCDLNKNGCTYVIRCELFLRYVVVNWVDGMLTFLLAYVVIEVMCYGW